MFSDEQILMDLIHFCSVLTEFISQETREVLIFFTVVLSWFIMLAHTYYHCV